MWTMIRYDPPRSAQMPLDASNWRWLRKYELGLRIGLLAVLMSSCDQSTREPRERNQAPVASTRPADAIPVIRQSSTARVPVAFSMGSTEFVAPTEVVGFQVGYQGENVDFVTLGLVLPDFVGRSRAASSERADSIHISLERRPSVPMPDLPKTREEAEARFARRFPDTRYVQSVNDELDLVEIRYKDGRDYVAYRRNDNYVRQSDGTVPYVVCLNPRLKLCDGHGYLSPDITVRYRFHIDQLSNWKKIDSGVFGAVEKFRQEDN